MSENDTQAALREMSRAIGGLESTVKGMLQTWQAQEASASQGRRDLHQKIDGLRDDFHSHKGELQTMGTQVAGALRDIADMRMTVDAVREARSQVVGASKLSKWLWRFAMFLSGGAAWVIINYINVSVRLK